MADGDDFNAGVIAEFRTNSGKVGGFFEGAPLLLLHHAGAKTGAERVTVWLSPELVDFSKPIKIDFKGKQLNHNALLTPDVQTLLDDALTRADRQHPFWVKVE